jgi:hypothetical protein
LYAIATLFHSAELNYLRTHCDRDERKGTARQQSEGVTFHLKMMDQGAKRMAVLQLVPRGGALRVVV